MKTECALIRRNTRLFFKDKGMFFTALITPLILLGLYATFLGKVYRDIFLSMVPPMLAVEQKLVDGYVGAQLISSILAVSCVTVAFCSNMLAVQDRANGTIKDLTISPVKKTTLAVSYYVSTLLSTLLICVAASGICFLYLWAVGWYMSVSDVALFLLDVVLLVMFGTALSSIVTFFLSTQGQISAVGTIISAGYGFVCGAYMPISQFTEGLQKVISFLPGTYGTALLRNHAMNGVFREMEALSFPEELIRAIRDSVDCNLYFFDEKVELYTMYLVLAGAVAVLIVICILLNLFRKKEK